MALGALVADLGETFGPVVEDEGRALVVNVSGAAQVRADRQMLVQALANLIQNALVHGAGEISLFADGARIGVADQGAGVPEAMRDEVLKPMVRLDAARTRAGSGLGLALVRAVAERHGARLTLSDQAPQGLKVTLNFADL